MLEAAIFDVDGTLVDSVDLHAQAWQEAFRHFNKLVTFRDIRHQIGKGADQLLPVFFSAAELAELGEELDSFRSELFKRKYLPRVRVFPKVRELFEKLRGDGVKIALASSAKRDELKKYKEIASIGDLVDEDTSSADAEKSKPHPDIFQAALRKLGRQDGKGAIAIGDTPYDARAAAQAGLHTIGVLCGGFPAEELLRAGCHSIYSNPADMLARYADWVVR